MWIRSSGWYSKDEVTKDGPSRGLQCDPQIQWVWLEGSSDQNLNAQIHASEFLFMDFDAMIRLLEAFFTSTCLEMGIHMLLPDCFLLVWRGYRKILTAAGNLLLDYQPARNYEIRFETIRTGSFWSNDLLQWSELLTSTPGNEGKKRDVFFPQNRTELDPWVSGPAAVLQNQAHNMSWMNVFFLCIRMKMMKSLRGREISFVLLLCHEAACGDTWTRLAD